MGSSNAEKYYATADGAFNQSYYVGWTYDKNNTTIPKTTGGTDSNAKKQTELWYKTNIETPGYDGKVANGKFCNDRDVESGKTWAATGTAFNYAGYNRRNGSPTLSCPSGDVYTLKVGAITLDEVMMAGGKYNTANSDYYLYTGSHYWTMSPFRWNSGAAQVFYVRNDGYLGSAYVHVDYGLRPVINLASTTTFATGGNGTANKPYIVQ